MTGRPGGSAADPRDLSYGIRLIDSVVGFLRGIEAVRLDCHDSGRPLMTIRARHLDIDELEARFRAAKDVVERSHCQAVWLLATAMLTGTAARAVSGPCSQYQ